MATYSATETVAGKARTDFDSPLTGLALSVSGPTAPIVLFIDPATPNTYVSVSGTNQIPSLGAVTLGTKYINYNYFRGLFFECTQAGTTGSSDTGVYFPGAEVVSGTAKFIAKSFTGWSNALGVVTDIRNASIASYGALYAHATGTTTGGILSQSTSKYVAEVSVAKVLLPTYQTGASAYALGGGMGRGITCTNSLNTLTATYGKAYDCSGPALGTTVHAIRCTLSDTAGAASILNGIVEACTVTTTGAPAQLSNASAAKTVLRGMDTSALAIPLFPAATASAFRQEAVGVKANAFVISGDASTAGRPLSARVSMFGGVAAKAQAALPGGGVNAPAATNPYLRKVPTVAVYKTGGIGYSYAAAMTGSIAKVAKFSFYNTKIDEPFDVCVDVLIANAAGSGVSDFNTEDVWLEAVYLRSAGDMSGALSFGFDKEDRRGLIVGGPAPINLSASAAAWTGAPAGALARTVKVTIAPKRIGPVLVTLRCWMTPYTRNNHTTNSASVWVDPTLYLAATP